MIKLIKLHKHKLLLLIISLLITLLIGFLIGRFADAVNPDIAIDLCVGFLEA